MTTSPDSWCHSMPGGRIGEMLPHPVYLLQSFLGSELQVENVQANKIGPYPWMRYDELYVSLRAKGGLGTIYISFNAPRDAIYLFIYGDKAIMIVEVITESLLKLTKINSSSRFDKSRDLMRQAYHLLASLTESAVKVISGRWISGHEMLIRLFADSLINNRNPPVSLEEACEVTRICEDICSLIP